MAKKSDPTRVSVDGRFHFSKVVRRFNDTTALLGGDVGYTLDSFTRLLGEKAGSAEVQAYTLLWTAQKNAVRKILGHHFRKDDYASQVTDNQLLAMSKSYLNTLLEDLPSLDIYIDRGFISAPTNHHSTNKLHQFFIDWAAKELQLNEKGARVLTAAFPRLLLSELAKLDKRDFTQLYTAFDSPFLDAEEKAQKLDAYQAQLIQEYDRPAFGNPAVRLDDVFIAPRFEYFRPTAEEGVAQRKDDFYPPDTPLPLVDLVTNWLAGKLPNDCPSQSPNLLLLLGQPGQGKSTFCNRLLFDLLTDNQGLAKNIFFVRLRDLEPNDGFLQQPIQTVLDHLNKYEFRKSILNFEDLDKSLLVLDGFDEYSMNHSLSQEEADNLIERLSSEILQHSKGGAPITIKCLLSSRTNYIRREKHQKNKDLLIVHLSEMNLNEQQEWVDKYSRSLDKTVYAEDELNQKKAFLSELKNSLNKLDKNSKYKSLRPLVNQPILLQIICDSEANPIQIGNKAALYERMIDFTIERKWAKEGQFNRLEGITSDRGKRRYRAFLHQLALFIFQSPNEYARRSDFKQGGLKKVVDDLKDHLEGQTEQSILKDLLVSFNLRQVRKSHDDHQEQDERNNYAFEFIHKSLQEYLVAELIWKTFAHDCLKEDEDGFTLGIEEAAYKIFDLLSPRIITREIQEYIFDLAESETDLFKENSDLYQRLRKIHFHLAEYDFLLYYDAKTNEMHSKNEHASPLMKQLAVFYGCIIVLGSIVKCVTRILRFPKKRNSTTVNFIEDQCAIYSFFHVGNQTQLAILSQRIYHFKLRLCFQDMRDTDFSDANLSGTELIGANLKGADLLGADLSEANLKGANLSNAFLIGTNLMDANLREANLRGADLSEANLVNAVLRGADLNGSSLFDTFLFRTDLQKADLSESDLSDSDLSGAKFSNPIGSNPARNLDKTLNLNSAKNKHLAHWKGTIYEGKFNTEEDTI